MWLFKTDAGGDRKLYILYLSVIKPGSCTRRGSIVGNSISITTKWCPPSGLHYLTCDFTGLAKFPLKVRSNGHGQCMSWSTKKEYLHLAWWIGQFSESSYSWCMAATVYVKCHKIAYFYWISLLWSLISFTCTLIHWTTR